MRISVIGVGKLGVCTASCFAGAGYEVIGVDVNRQFIDAINEGRAPLYEPGLQEMMDSCGRRLTATMDYEKAMAESDMTFLIVPTPSRGDGSFSDEYLRDGLAHLARAMKRLDKKRHVFVITSTVSPGTTEKHLIPLIEAESGKSLGRDFGVAYNPEFIALGSVIRDFLNPDVVLIGASDRETAEQVESVYRRTCANDPYVAAMSIVSAEVAKISLNSYVTMKISFANTLANLCERIPGASVDDITAALGADKRVSSHYLKGGLSFGGPCFPRDNKAFTTFAAGYGIDARLARATEEVNSFQIENLVSVVRREAPEGRAVAVLGLAYKPGTPVIERSPSIDLIEDLLSRETEIVAYDPLSIDNVRARFGDSILYASSVRDCFEAAGVVVLATADPEFAAIDESYVVHDGTLVIDCWRVLDTSRLGQKALYMAVGWNPETPWSCWE